MMKTNYKYESKLKYLLYIQMNISNLQDVKKRFIQLHPVNAASGGQYSFRNGLPLIKFDISASMMPLFLDGSELRISGRLTAKTAANAA